MLHLVVICVFVIVLAELVGLGSGLAKSLGYCINKSLSVDKSFGIGTNVLSLGASVCCKMLVELPHELNILFFEIIFVFLVMMEIQYG